MKSNYFFIDVAKSIGIVLVVVGHAPSVPKPISDFIYGFHIPLFFFISGFLISEQRIKSNWFDYTRNQFGKTMIPYFFFGVLSLAYWSFKSLAFSNNEHSFLEAIVGLFLGYGDVLFINTPLWFFTCLFSVFMLFKLLFTFVSGKYLLLTSFLISLSSSYLFPIGSIRLPWCFENSLVALVFFVAGFEFKRTMFMKYRLMGNKYLLLVLCLFFLFFVQSIIMVNGRVDLNDMKFGWCPILYFLCSMLGLSSVLLFSFIIRENNMISWLSKNTKTIFPMHGIMFSVFTGVLQVIFGFDEKLRDSLYLVWFFYSLLAVILCYPLSLVLCFSFPKLFNGKVN